MPSSAILIDKISGIDVSHHDGVIDWSKVAANQIPAIRFGIAKATQGDYFWDSRFNYNWAGMKDVGIPRGAYHFFDCRIDPIKQARTFLNKVGSFPDLPPILDVEWLGDVVEPEPYKLSQLLDTCLSFIQQKTGRIPWIYTSMGYWNTHLPKNSNLTKKYGLWVANYRVDYPRLPSGWSSYWIWQWTEAGSVYGVPTAVDMNLWYGDEASWKKFLNDNSVPANPPPIVIEPPATGLPYDVKINTAVLTVRLSATMYSPVRGYVLAGQVVTILEISNLYWGKIMYNGGTGWINLKYTVRV